MVDQLEDVIVNAYDRTWFDDYKSNWIKRIHRYFNTNNIAHVSMALSLDAVLLRFGNRANQRQPGILSPQKLLKSCVVITMISKARKEQQNPPYLNLQQRRLPPFQYVKYLYHLQKFQKIVLLLFYCHLLLPLNWILDLDPRM